MSIYNINGEQLPDAYDLNSENLSEAYDISGTEVFLSGDYDEWTTEYQHSILNARDEWKAQYRADETVVPIILHTDQHNRFAINGTNANIIALFEYLGLAINWDEVSAMIGLGDVDLSVSDVNYYLHMNRILDSACDRSKQINIWGNHDLWNNYTTDEDNQFVVDFETTYTNFSNESYGDYSYAYNHKGIEYHIDEAHNIKYVCIAGWEIDADIGGYSHYNISQQSMDDIIDMLEMEDGYDIVILSHCTPFTNGGNRWDLSAGGTSGSDTFYETPISGTGALTSAVDSSVALDDMLVARNNKTSGTITDTYGNVHAYDFTNCTGNIICCLMGHGHQDRYGYDANGGILTIMYDAFAYNTNPFYMINIDRTNGTVDGWKVTSDAVVQSYSIPLSEVTNNDNQSIIGTH